MLPLASLSTIAEPGPNKCPNLVQMKIILSCALPEFGRIQFPWTLEGQGIYFYKAKCKPRGSRIFLSEPPFLALEHRLLNFFLLYKYNYYSFRDDVSESVRIPHRSTRVPGQAHTTNTHKGPGIPLYVAILGTFFCFSFLFLFFFEPLPFPITPTSFTQHLHPSPLPFTLPFTTTHPLLSP